MSSIISSNNLLGTGSRSMIALWTDFFLGRIRSILFSIFYNLRCVTSFWFAMISWFSSNWSCLIEAMSGGPEATEASHFYFMISASATPGWDFDGSLYFAILCSGSATSVRLKILCCASGGAPEFLAAICLRLYALHFLSMNLPKSRVASTSLGKGPISFGNWFFSVLKILSATELHSGLPPGVWLPSRRIGWSSPTPFMKFTNLWEQNCGPLSVCMIKSSVFTNRPILCSCVIPFFISCITWSVVKLTCPCREK